MEQLQYFDIDISELFPWEQFVYFGFFFYLEIFGWEQLKKPPCIILYFIRRFHANEEKLTKRAVLVFSIAFGSLSSKARLLRWFW